MKKIILFIIVFAFILRIVGIDYGLPMFFIPDEVSITGASLKMIELRTLIPALYPEEFRLLYYPPLMSYIYLIFIIPVLALQFLLGVSDLSALKEMIVLDPTPVWLTARVVTAVIGTLTVYLTYIIGNRLFGRTLGIFASVFMAGSFLAVQLSHFARHWMPATFFTYLIIAFAILIYFKKDRKNYIWAGAISGIAFGVSFITGIGLLVIFLAHFLSISRSREASPDRFQYPFDRKTTGSSLMRGVKEWFRRIFLDKNLWSMMLFFVIIGGIFSALNFPEFQRRISGEDITIGMEKTFSGAIVALGQSFLSFFEYEPILVSLGVVGIIVLFFSKKRLFVLFLSFPIVYWLLLYFFIHFEPRYNLLLVPWFAILAGLALLQIWELSFGENFMKFAVIIVLILPFTVPVYYDYLLTRDDSREQAKVWIEENISENSSIALFSKTLELTPNRQAVENLFVNYPGAVRTKHKVLREISGERYPDPAYNVFVFDGSQNEPSLSSFDYVVVEYFEEKPDNLAGFEEIISFNSVEEERLDVNGNIFESIINIFRVKNLGPKVEIYKI